MSSKAEKDIQVRLDQLYWEDVEPSMQQAYPAVSSELLMLCRLKILTRSEFEQVEQTLKDVAASIPMNGFAEVDWHRTRWTASHLINHCGFTRSDEPTMLLVQDTALHVQGRAQYAIKYIYLPLERESTPMRALCEYVFDERGAVRDALRPAGGLRGQSLVCRRGSKAMNAGALRAVTD